MPIKERSLGQSAPFFKPLDRGDNSLIERGSDGTEALQGKTALPKESRPTNFILEQLSLLRKNIVFHRP